MLWTVQICTCSQDVPSARSCPLPAQPSASLCQLTSQPKVDCRAVHPRDSLYIWHSTASWKRHRLSPSSVPGRSVLWQPCTLRTEATESRCMSCDLVSWVVFVCLWANLALSPITQDATDTLARLERPENCPTQFHQVHQSGII
jgi:hypothetical protein